MEMPIERQGSRWVSREGLCLRMAILVRSLHAKRAVELSYYNKIAFCHIYCWEDQLIFFLKNVIELKCTDMICQKERGIGRQKTWVLVCALLRAQNQMLLIF